MPLPRSPARDHRSSDQLLQLLNTTARAGMSGLMMMRIIVIIVIIIIIIIITTTIIGVLAAMICAPLFPLFYMGTSRLMGADGATDGDQLLCESWHRLPQRRGGGSGCHCVRGEQQEKA